MPMSPPNVYQYRDYRLLLRDLFEWRKSQADGYSFRRFSADAGLNSPNYLKLVIDGQRNLSLDKAVVFGKAFNLNSEETAFLGLLVRFGNARDSEEKSLLFELIENHTRAEGGLDNLDAYQAYFSHWAYPVIGLLLGMENASQDPKQLARMLKPAIPADEVRKAFSVLETLGYTAKNEKGDWEVKTPSLETPLEIRNVWMRQYHTRVLERAIAALDEVEQEKRNVSTFAVSLPKSQIPEFMSHVHRLRRELFRYAQTLSKESDDPDDTVLQLAVQAFPVAEVDKEM